MDILPFVFYCKYFHHSTKVVLEASRLTVKILSTSFSFAGGQNLETAEAECRICFGDTKAAEALKRNYIA